MTLIQKILIGVAAMIIAGGSVYLAFNQINKEEFKNDNLQKIVADYESLLNEAEKIQTSSSDCSNKNLSQDIKNLEEKLSKLNKRAKTWWENRPKLPDIPSDIIDEQNKTEIESPKLTDEQEKQIKEDLFGSKESSNNVPPLPDLPEEVKIESPKLTDEQEKQIKEDLFGSKESSNNVPPLPDLPEEVKIESPKLTDEQEKQIKEDLFGSKESSNNVPPLPDLNIEVVDYDIEKLKNLPTKIKNIIDTLKKLNDTCNKKAMDAVSDKCEDACARYKKCAAWPDHTTPEDLADAYDSCMVECTGSETPPGWSKKVIKCINAVEIKKPNDCVVFVNCQLPEQIENKYTPIKEYYKKLNNK
jgi:hypothetical protein